LLRGSRCLALAAGMPLCGLLVDHLVYSFEQFFPLLRRFRPPRYPVVIHYYPQSPGVVRVTEPRPVPVEDSAQPYDDS